MKNLNSRWRNDGVRIVRAADLDSNTPQTAGMQRRAAVTTERTGATQLWAGTVTIDANARRERFTVDRTTLRNSGAMADRLARCRGQACSRPPKRCKTVRSGGGKAPLNRVATEER